ncbi:MAG: GNAT family N-acetyltransferase [Elusimicrobia bacterium]|nr:GNAT family N-acetyltransferase [Elusimicrobiota bacterium]
MKNQPRHRRNPPATIQLRDAKRGDVPAFYAMHADPEANRAGAFVPRKKADFFKHWAKVLKNRLNLKKAVLHNGKLAGYLVSFYRTGTGKPKKREIGYWIAREHWGKGIATGGLRLLLQEHRIRPLFARVAKTNPASRRVAEKCGFKLHKEDSYRNEAGTNVQEYILKLAKSRSHE